MPGPESRNIPCGRCHCDQFACGEPLLDRLRRKLDHFGIAAIAQRDAAVGIEHAQTLVHMLDGALVQRETGLQCLVLPPEVGQLIRAPWHAAPPFSSFRSGVPLRD